MPTDALRCPEPTFGLVAGALLDDEIDDVVLRGSGGAQHGQHVGVGHTVVVDGEYPVTDKDLAPCDGLRQDASDQPPPQMEAKAGVLGALILIYLFEWDCRVP